MAEASVGPYRILERLGAGANGEVFLAEDTRLRRRVALKTLAGTGGSDAAEPRRKLLREARAAARLNHPNIAAVYDVLDSVEGVHIVMEYVPGATLAARVRQGPLPPMQVLDLALQLSGALAHAHELGVVHRDLKPANVIVSPSGQAKILDFGLARLHEVDAGSVHLSASDASTTDARQVVGTPPYMPPELLRGEGFDARGDIYSLGVSLFELLTGRRPFEARDGMALTAAILTAPTPRPRSITPDVPADLDEVVYRAMARDAKDRHRSAMDLQGDLKRLTAAITDPPTMSRPLSRLWPPGRRRLGGTALACVAVAVGVYGAIGPGRWPWPSPATTAAPHATGPHVVAVLPLAGAAGDPQTESLAAGVADALITTLSKVPGLTVVSRAATLKYQERKHEPDDIARELGATMLVDGGLQRSGDRLRVTLSLLHAGSKVVRWQGAYDGTFGEVFTLQREVADAVAGALRLNPTPDGAGEPPPTTSLDAFADYAQARTFIERPDVRDNLDRAIQLFQSAIRRDSRFARAHAGLGEAYWRKYQATREERWSVEARDAINEALRLDPHDSSVRLSLASVYRGMGRMPEAGEELRKVITARPQSDEAYRQLGLLLVETGRVDEALEQLRAAIRLRPNYWAHHHALGAAYYKANRYPEAIAAFGRVTELQPDNGWGYQMLGTSYHAMNDAPNAKANYLRAITLGTPKAHGNLGILYYDQGAFEDALRHFSAAADLAPESPLNHHNIGDALVRLGRPAHAREAYRRAARLCAAQIRVNPRDASTMATLAVVETKLGLKSEGAARIARATSLAPADADIRYAEAVVHALSGRTQEAFGALEAAVRGGYSTERAHRDPDLALLRSHQRYTTVIRLEAHSGGS